MKIRLLAAFCFLMAAAPTGAQENLLRNAIHVGGGMGYDAYAGLACMQASVAASIHRVYIQTGITLPGDKEQPVMYQLRTGYVAGNNLKGIVYAGIAGRSAYPVNYFAPTYGLELSVSVVPGARFFTDLNFTGKAWSAAKQAPVNNQVQFITMLGIKCTLGKKDCE